MGSGAIGGHIESLNAGQSNKPPNDNTKDIQYILEQRSGPLIRSVEGDDTDDEGVEGEFGLSVIIRSIIHFSTRNIIS